MNTNKKITSETLNKNVGGADIIFSGRNTLSLAGKDHLINKSKRKSKKSKKKSKKSRK